MYTWNGFTGTVVEKWIGRQYNGSGISQGSTYLGKVGLIPAYDQTDLTLIYKINHGRVEVGVYNLFDKQAITASKVKTVIPTGLEQYTFQPGINYQATVRFDY